MGVGRPFVVELGVFGVRLQGGRDRVFEHAPDVAVPAAARLTRSTGRECIHGEASLAPPFSEERQPPPALFALALDVLLAHGPPQQVVVGHAFPCARHLRGSAERDGVEVAKHLKGDFAREDFDGVDAHLEGERLLQERELGRAGDREESAENEESTLGGSRGKEAPDRVDRLLLVRAEVLDRLRGGPSVRSILYGSFECNSYLL